MSCIRIKIKKQNQEAWFCFMNSNWLVFTKTCMELFPSLEEISWGRVRLVDVEVVGKKHKRMNRVKILALDRMKRKSLKKYIIRFKRKKWNKTCGIKKMKAGVNEKKRNKNIVPMQAEDLAWCWEEESNKIKKLFLIICLFYC